MLGIAVGTHLHLIPRPRLGSELQTNFVSLLIGDVLFGREGLDILVEVDPVQLTIGGFSSHKLCERIGTVTVHTADKSTACLWVSGLTLPLTIPHDNPHSTDMLLGFLDVGHCCQSLPPIRIRAS